MTLAIKSAGVWKPATTGKVTVLTGSAPDIYRNILAAGPVNFWPLRDPPGSNNCEDIIGTKDTTYSGNVSTSRPNPFVNAKQQYVPLPGGNPVKAFGSTGYTIECIFRTLPGWGGSIFGYQNAPPTGSVNGNEGFVPALYIATDGVLRGTFYPLTQSVGPVVNDGKYHHAALVYNATTQSQQMYCDGVAVGGYQTGVPAFITWPGTTKPAAFNDYAQIGASFANGGWTGHANTGWWYFEGDIFYFAVYNHPLVASEMAKRRAPNWNYASKVAIKIGPQGGGYWKDSGYVGVPGTPPAPTVWAWNYYNVHTRWDAPSGGAPVESYETQLLLSDNTVSATATTTALDYRWADLTPQGRYKMRVRAKSATGVYSPWSAELRVEMGLAEQQIPHSEYRTRPWYTNWYTDPVGQGGWIACPNAPNVTTYQLRLNVALANGSTPFSGSGAGRKANWLINNADGGYVGFKNSPWNEDVPWGVSANAWQGIWLTGTGWSSSGNWLGYGTVHLWGNETYLYQWTETIPAIPNGYW